MQTQTRTVGSGFTVFTYNGQRIAFLDEVTDTGQQPIVGYQAVTQLDSPFPDEFATARVLAEGTLTLTIRELWNQRVWEALVGLAGTNNIVDIYNRIAQTSSPIQAMLVIKPPTGPARGKIYHGMQIVAVDDREQVAIGTLTMPRTITAVYTNTTPYILQ